jgi:flagellin-like hook-associated protein FlgL
LFGLKRSAGVILETQRTLRLKTGRDYQDRFTDNLSFARRRLEATYSALDQVNAILLKAKEMAVRTTDSNSDPAVLRRTAKELDKLLAEILEIFGDQAKGDYPFSEKHGETQRETGCQGNRKEMELEVLPGLNMKLNSLDSDILTEPLKTLGEDGDLNPRIGSNTRLSDLNLGKIKLTLGGSETVIDLGTASTVGEIIGAISDSAPDVIVSLNSSRTGISVEPKVAGKSLVIFDGDEKKSATALGISGSPDLLGTFLVLMEGLRKGDRKGISEGLETLDLGRKEVWDHKAEAEAKLKRLDSAQDRLTASQTDLPGLFSEVSREDLSRVAAGLANQQSLFRSVLKRRTAMTQPAFLEFIK